MQKYQTARQHERRIRWVSLLICVDVLFCFVFFGIAARVQAFRDTFMFAAYLLLAIAAFFLLFFFFLAFRQMVRESRNSDAYTPPYRILPLGDDLT